MKRETWLALFLAALIAGIIAAHNPAGAEPPSPPSVSVGTAMPAASP
jgi:hypothetical protein